MEDLFGEAMARLDLCEERVEQMRRAGAVFAETSAEYRKAIRKATLQERARGTAATLTSDLVRGRDDIADLGVARDCAENDARAFQEVINVNKLRARILNDQLNREWGQAGRSV